VTTTRQGWRSALDLRLLAFTVIVCGSLPLLACSSVFSLARDVSRSHDGILRHSSGLPSSSIPGDNNDIDDNDDDDSDDDDAGALPGDAIRLTADRGPIRLLVETHGHSRSSLHWESGSLRGPPRKNLDEQTRSIDRDISDRIAPPPAWTAARSHRQPQNPSHDTQDVDERDFDDRDDDDDDDDDDESAGALLAASAMLESGHADGRRLIPARFGAHSPVSSEAQSLRGPPSRILADRTSSLRHGIPNHTSLFLIAPHGHWLRAPPRSFPPTRPGFRAHTSIATASRRT